MIFGFKVLDVEKVRMDELDSNPSGKMLSTLEYKYMFNDLFILRSKPLVSPNFLFYVWIFLAIIFIFLKQYITTVYITLGFLFIFFIFSRHTYYLGLKHYLKKNGYKDKVLMISKDDLIDELVLRVDNE